MREEGEGVRVKERGEEEMEFGSGRERERGKWERAESHSDCTSPQLCDVAL